MIRDSDPPFQTLTRVVFYLDQPFSVDNGSGQRVKTSRGGGGEGLEYKKGKGSRRLA